MKFYNEQEALYLETDASSVGLGVGLLQTREGMTCPCDEAADNIELCPIAFTSQNLSNADISNIQRAVLSTLHGL